MRRFASKMRSEAEVWGTFRQRPKNNFHRYRLGRRRRRDDSIDPGRVLRHLLARRRVAGGAAITEIRIESRRAPREGTAQDVAGPASSGGAGTGRPQDATRLGSPRPPILAATLVTLFRQPRFLAAAAAVSIFLAFTRGQCPLAGIGGTRPAQPSVVHLHVDDDHVRQLDSNYQYRVPSTRVASHDHCVTSDSFAPNLHALLYINRVCTKIEISHSSRRRRHRRLRLCLRHRADNYCFRRTVIRNDAIFIGLIIALKRCFFQFFIFVFAYLLAPLIRNSSPPLPYSRH